MEEIAKQSNYVGVNAPAITASAGQTSYQKAIIDDCKSADGSKALAAELTTEVYSKQLVIELLTILHSEMAKISNKVTWSDPVPNSDNCSSTLADDPKPKTPEYIEGNLHSCAGITKLYFLFYI